MGQLPALRAGIDIGGTFTDLAMLDESGIVAVGKTLTTAREPAAGVAAVLDKTCQQHGLDPADIDTIVHGTTLVTNALIQRRGARTALLTTAGFRDVVEMGREHRYELYDLALELPQPLVPRHLRFEVRERMLADGSVETPLDEAMVTRLAGELAAAGVEALAVCFLHSHTNPNHERRAKELVTAAAPSLRVTCSADVNPEIREYERASTTLANTYVQDLVQRYLDDLRQRLQNLGVRPDPLIMLSNGGVATVEVAREFPIRMLESGPAGGAFGAVAFGRAAARPDQLSFDMGGTTAKLCAIEDHRPLVTHTFEVDRVYRLRAGSGLPVRAPVLDMIEIGTGGGSIARVNALGLVTVGPDSAGSEPGPVSYGRGGQRCTVTDADVVLGYLDPEGFADSKLDLDVAAARAAVAEQIAEPLGVDVPDAAWGVHATANDGMANAAKMHAIERGHAPGKLALFVSGGNGPLHGPGVARALGSPSVLVPPAAGVLSTLGFLAAPMSIDTTRSWHIPVEEVSPAEAAELLGQLRQDGINVLANSGVPRADITCQATLEMRYVGQGNELEIVVDEPDTPGHPATEWPAEVTARFAAQYAARFGTAPPGGVDAEILTWRITASGPDPHAVLRIETDEQAPAPALIKHRLAYFAQHGYLDTPVYDRYRLAAASVLTGPALVQEREATLVLAPDMQATVAEDTSLKVEFEGAAP